MTLITEGMGGNLILRGFTWIKVIIEKIKAKFLPIGFRSFTFKLPCSGSLLVPLKVIKNVKGSLASPFKFATTVSADLKLPFETRIPTHGIPTSLFVFSTEITGSLSLLAESSFKITGQRDFREIYWLLFDED